MCGGTFDDVGVSHAQSVMVQVGFTIPSLKAASNLNNSEAAWLHAWLKLEQNSWLKSQVISSQLWMQVSQFDVV